MKRQEKKNPPQPPVLLAKISGADAKDWTRPPDDLKNLLEWMSREMNVHFGANIKSFGQILPILEQSPVLCRSGCKAFKPSN